MDCVGEKASKVLMAAAEFVIIRIAVIVFQNPTDVRRALPKNAFKFMFANTITPITTLTPTDSFGLQN